MTTMCKAVEPRCMNNFAPANRHFLVGAFAERDFSYLGCSRQSQSYSTLYTTNNNNPLTGSDWTAKKEPRTSTATTTSVQQENNDSRRDRLLEASRDGTRPHGINPRSIERERCHELLQQVDGHGPSFHNKNIGKELHSE